MSISEYLFNDVKEEFRQISSNSWVDEHVKSLDDESLTNTSSLNAYKGVLFMTYRRLQRLGSSTIKEQQDAIVPQEVKDLSGLEVIKQFFVQGDSGSGVVI